MEFFAVLAIASAAIFLLFKLFKGPSKKRPGDTITGKAYVTDGDGIRVSGYNIRLAGLDAPEWDQLARDQHGDWFNEGKRVKSALIRAIGGKYVRVTVEGYDKYGRVIGPVTCNGKDVGNGSSEMDLQSLHTETSTSTSNTKLAEPGVGCGVMPRPTTQGHGGTGKRRRGGTSYRLPVIGVFHISRHRPGRG